MLAFLPELYQRDLTLYNAHVSDERLKVSRTTFVKIMTEDTPFGYISVTEREICDICMNFWHKLRMLDALYVLHAA